MKCGDCINKRIHMITHTGKVYWKCIETNDIVHAFDNCKISKQIKQQDSKEQTPISVQ